MRKSRWAGCAHQSQSEGAPCAVAAPEDLCATQHNDCAPTDISGTGRLRDYVTEHWVRWAYSGTREPMSRKMSAWRTRLGRAATSREIESFEKMLRLYCAHHHTSEPCADCCQLLEKVRMVLANCPFGDKKPLCSRCSENCLDSRARITIADVMRYSGPRMLYRYPLLTILHFLDLLREGPEISEHSTPT